jgi:hypothetical protein
VQLLDHFHPPLSTVRHWESFQARWAASIADALNDDLLPADYFAEVQVHVGSRVEVDVGTFADDSARATHGRSDTLTATLPARTWAPPGPAMTMPAVFPDSLEFWSFIVTNRHANLHNALVHLLDIGAQFLLPAEPLYATAYHPVRHAAAEEINVWAATLAVGQPLPLLPLPLDKALRVPLDLGATYGEACQRTRLA